MPPPCNAAFQFPGPGFASCLVDGAGGLTISPKVVHVGDHLTASLQPPAATFNATWDWQVFVAEVGGGHKVSPCKPQAPSCTVKASATASSSSWEAFVHGVNVNPIPCCGGLSVSSDYFIINDNLYQLSGTVTDEQGQPAAGVPIEVSGNSTTSRFRTTPAGRYVFALPRGVYRVAVTGESAAGSKPRSRSVSLDHNVYDADFRINPCPGAGASGDIARSAAGGSVVCDLKMFVKTLEPPRSGLAVHGHPYVLYPVDFVGVGNNCESGCTDVLITVIDPKAHQPVVGATVNVSVGALEGVAGKGHLCAGAECASHLLGLQTDEHGQVRLLYWTPGVIKKESTTLNVTAKVACTATACPAKEKEGAAKTSLTTAPYAIYETSATLSKEEVDALADYAGGTSFFDRVTQTTSAISLVLNSAIASYNAFAAAAGVAVAELAGLEVVEAVVVIPLEIAHVTKEVWEREGMISLFRKKTNLSPAGLDANPVEAWAATVYNGPFKDQLIAPGVLLPFKAGAGGVLWRVAGFLRERQQIKVPSFPDLFDHTTWKLALSIYEVSHCDPGKGSCEPGYAGLVRTSTVINPGIEPELYFDLRIVGNPGPGRSFVPKLDEFDQTFTMPYDAVAWTETQQRLRGVIRDSQ